MFFSTGVNKKSIKSIGFQARPRIPEDFRRFSKQIHEWPARLELPARPRPSKKSRPSPARSKISEITELSQISRPPKKVDFFNFLGCMKRYRKPNQSSSWIPMHQKSSSLLHFPHPNDDFQRHTTAISLVTRDRLARSGTLLGTIY